MRNYKKMSCLDYEIMREIYNFNLLSEYNDVCIASIFNDRRRIIKKIGMSKEEYSYFKKFGVIKKD